jgi:hypothetical protein
MVSTPAGIAMLATPDALKNARSPMLIRLLGAVKETPVTLAAFSNALVPIPVTVFGIVTAPTQAVWPVTTLSVIVNVPLVLQPTELVAALAETLPAASRPATPSISTRPSQLTLACPRNDMPRTSPNRNSPAAKHPVGRAKSVTTGVARPCGRYQTTGAPDVRTPARSHLSGTSTRSATWQR